MDVAIVGINFKTASLALRETVVKEVHSLLKGPYFFRHCPAVVLVTCNRIEIYFSALDVERMKIDLISLLQERAGELLERCFYFYRDWECFFHLCCVAAGLDSAILGETEILRQIKASYLRSSNAFALPSVLHYVFQKALRVAKSNRYVFFLEKKMPSLFSTLWQMMDGLFGKNGSLKVLLVGYSEIHREFASFLNYKGVKEIAFCTRYPEKIRVDPQKKIYSREELKNWTAYDVISCATHSENFLIRGKGMKKHLLFDLSMPRTIGPEVAGADLFLFNMEQINAIFETDKMKWQDLFEEAKDSLEEHALKLFRLYEERRVIKNLHVQGI